MCRKAFFEVWNIDRREKNIYICTYALKSNSLIWNCAANKLHNCTNALKRATYQFVMRLFALDICKCKHKHTYMLKQQQLISTPNSILACARLSVRFTCLLGVSFESLHLYAVKCLASVCKAYNNFSMNVFKWYPLWKFC